MGPRGSDPDVPPPSDAGRSLEGFIAASLDESPFTPYHARVIALIIAGLFFDLLDVGILGSLAPDMLRQGFIQPHGVALVVSATFAGILIGSIGQGEFTDRFGRKTIYQFNLLLYGLATLAAAAAPDYVTLAACRFVAGLGLGAEIPLAYAYVAEFAPRRIRGRVLSIVNLFGGSMAIPLGILMALLLRDTIGWRGVLAVIGVGALIVFLLRIGLPESPRWLAAKGRRQAALDIMARFGVARESAPHAASGIMRERTDPVLLVLRHFRRRLVALMASLFCVNIGIYLIVSWLPALLGRQGFGVAESLRFSLVIAIAFPLSSVILSFVLDRFGRIRTVMTAFVLAACMAVLFTTQAGVREPTVALLSIGFFLALFINIAGNTLIMMSGELFPTHARASGGGLALGAGRLGAILASYLVIGMLGYGGWQGVFLALSLFMLCGAVSAWMILLDLGGDSARRSLEEIAEPGQAQSHGRRPDQLMETP